VSRDATITWSDVTVTSLAVAVTTAEYTVAFVAMDDGTVRKVRLSKSDYSRALSILARWCHRIIAFTALTLLVGHQEGHTTCKII